MFINVIEDMYNGLCTSVKGMYGEIKKCQDKSMNYEYNKSALSPYLFSVYL